MCDKCSYTIHSAQHHFGWDNSFVPAARVEPGATIKFECMDSSGGQLGPSSSLADVMALEFSKINPVSGPIFVEGAEPGDVLKVTIDSFTPQVREGAGFGWTANIPGFGLLTDQFPDPALHVWKFDHNSMSPSLFGKEAKIPLRPFAGTIGNALKAPGHHSVVPPRNVGGNLDIRDLTAGTVLYLPIEVAGALFSVGDTHAAQGDGEVCGTAIESPFDVVLTLDLIKDQTLKMPRFTTNGPVTNHIDSKGYEVTTGVGPDLLTAARDAVSGMIDLLGATRAMSAMDAYMLSSVCGDLRISEIVDMPNFVVSFYMPNSVFE